MSHRSSSCYWYSLSKLEVARKRGEGYGEALAWMHSAWRLVSQAIDLCKQRQHSIPPSMLTPVATTFMEAVRRERASQEEDNRTIYVEPLPEVLGLEVPSFALAKSVPELPAAYDQYMNIFPSLLPPQILIESGTIKQTSAELRRTMVNQARTRTDEARCFSLFSLSLYIYLFESYCVFI